MENYSERLIEALAYAARAHVSHVRKSTRIPYLSHLLAVTAIVMEAGGTETEAIAVLKVVDSLNVSDP